MTIMLVMVGDVDEGEKRWREMFVGERKLGKRREGGKKRKWKKRGSGKGKIVTDLG